MISDEYFQSKLAFRGRGLADLDRLIGGVGDTIDALSTTRNPVRILELGCGYGTALLELAARYGDRVTLTGVNRNRHDGNPEILIRNAVVHGLWSANETARKLPSLHYADVARGLPFADAAFDLVYSQVAWMYFGDKLAVLRHVMRVLAPDGIAKIDVDELRPGLPNEYRRLVEIWEKGKLVPFGDYVRRYGVDLLPAREGQYLRFGPVRDFASDVELVLEIDASTIHADWDGIKCVYRVTP
ncbi:MAG TPA: class I SAM-dependent methyltransferase [Casimicrobiaceae bacterium]|nr:class I SAM-dependent methyltransferase [Casimicrobiaceae bacterium]